MSKAEQAIVEFAEEWREFLLLRPPGSRSAVNNAVVTPRTDYAKFDAKTPILQLFCNGKCQVIDNCSGSRVAQGYFFAGREKLGSVGNQPVGNLPYDFLLLYNCERCGYHVKSYMIRFWKMTVPYDKPPDSGGECEVEKVAEWPAFSPQTPSKVISLIGPDREAFLKGRRAESEGLGVGAFAYYRQIIERQKNRLLDEVIRVAKHENAPSEAISTLEAAKAETQFSKAVTNVKDVIPQSLMIEGHNPLTLLHSVLSEGIHDATDEHCLLLANDIRLILIEFAERVTATMKEKNQLKDALSRILNRKSPE